VATTSDDLSLFCLEASRPFTEAMARELDVPVAAHEERDFEDGEHKVRPLETVRGRDVFLVQSLHGDERWSVNDKLARCLFFIGALKDASAARVTAVVPYLAYARKDRKTKSRDPVTTRYIARLFEAVGADRVLTMDVHNRAAYDNAFDIPADHIEARPLFVDYFANLVRDSGVIVLSPDTGGVKRADAFRQSFTKAIGREAGIGFAEKYRSEGVVSGETLVADVEGKTVVMVDDLISTGTTLIRAAEACRERGAKAVYAAATHGVFVGGAEKLFASEAIERIVVTDTIPPLTVDRHRVGDKLAVLGAAPLFAKAIAAIHDGGSITALTEV